MAQNLTHESVVAPSGALEPLADLGDDVRDQLVSVLERRSNIHGGPLDAIIHLEDWAHEQWSDFDIADGPYVLAEEVEDFSEDAYLVRGAFEVQMDEIEGRSTAEVEDGALSDQLDKVDESDTEFHEESGEMFLPKSAVQAIHVNA